jgi:hypothetical protein
MANFFGTSTWATAGGDYNPAASASQTVPVTLGLYNWGSAQLTADVQDMLDNAANNHGWLLKHTDESGNGTARRFDDSR